MTYFFNVKNYGMADHLFKIVNVNLSDEIKRIKDNPKAVRYVEGFPVDYEAYIIVIGYHRKPNEVYFFKSISYGIKKYTEIRKAIGIRI